jgi:hypothetical protein
LSSFILSKNGGAASADRVVAGESGILGNGEEAQFRVMSGSSARLIRVDPKAPHQELTIDRFALDSEDGSDRNATLLVAITDCRFRDVRNLGDESEWTPSKPEIVAMSAGSVRWIRPGIHHFTNLGSQTAKVVSIEW